MILLHRLCTEKAIHFHPASLAPALRGIPVPTYGSYGGPGHSGPGDPVDALDMAFQVHDRASAAALTPGDQSAADAVLIGKIQNLDTTGQIEDPEASLYAGFATLAIMDQADRTIQV
jgi:hypothetical protein